MVDRDELRRMHGIPGLYTFYGAAFRSQKSFTCSRIQRSATMDIHSRVLKPVPWSISFFTPFITSVVIVVLEGGQMCDWSYVVFSYNCSSSNLR